jgi:hypothetical protein
MADTDARPVDYKTHILIGVRANGVMTVICDWPHVPTQADVQEEMEGARDGYVAFALCTRSLRWTTTPAALRAARGSAAWAEGRVMRNLTGQRKFGEPLVSEWT